MAARSADHALPSAEDVAKITHFAMARLFNASYVGEILSSSAAEAGFPHLFDGCQAAQTESKPSTTTTGGKRKKKEDKKEKKDKPVRQSSIYNIFTTKALGILKKNPSYAQPLGLPPGEGDRPLNGMAVASALWRRLDGKTKAEFAHAYQVWLLFTTRPSQSCHFNPLLLSPAQPLCEQMKAEQIALGHKVSIYCVRCCNSNSL